MGVVKSKKHVPSSTISAPASLDRLSALLERFRVRTRLFHSGAMCGTSVFEPLPGRAFLHVLRDGTMVVKHPRAAGIPRTVEFIEPTALLYPRPVHHTFVNPPQDGSALTCATLDFDGGDRNPLVQALPALVAVPLRQVEGLEPALDLLFSETDRVRCGSRLLADRLFEVVLIQLLRWMIDHPARVGIDSGLIVGLSDLRLAKALVALHRSPAQAWTLHEMAQEAGMSRAAFAAAFKAATGTAPAEYLGNWRLTLATSMLRAGQPVKCIASAVGYSTPSALSKAFRQRFGTAPRDWIARHSKP